MSAIARELDYPDRVAQERLELIKGYTDGVEALLAQINAALAPLSTEAKLEAVRAAVDGLEGKDYATQATLAAVLAAVDGLEAKDYATQSTLAAVLAATDDLEGKDFATESTVGRKYGGGKTTRATQIAAAGDSPLITPSPGKRVRLLWIGMSTSEGNAGEVLVLVKFGTDVHYRWNMGAPGGFSHWEVVEGAVDQPLVVNLSQPYPVEFNYTYVEF